MDVDNRVAEPRGGRLRMPRSRGAISGFLLILLGAWGALIPFVGPYFDFAYAPDEPWVWSSARGWLEVLPGAVTAFGGLLLLETKNRLIATLGGWLAAAAGAWYVIGLSLATLLRIGTIGEPLASSDAKRALLQLTYFSGLGALILFLAATALGRLSIRSVRDVRFASRDVSDGRDVGDGRNVGDGRDGTVAPQQERAASAAAPARAATGSRAHQSGSGWRRLLGGRKNRPPVTSDSAANADPVQPNRGPA